MNTTNPILQEDAENAESLNCRYLCALRGLQ
jgi:hypothetical protein